jgi:RNA-directed DNA polymerase
MEDLDLQGDNSPSASLSFPLEKPKDIDTVTPPKILNIVNLDDSEAIRELRKEYNKEIASAETDQVTVKTLNNLYRLNKLNPDKENNNLIKLISDPEILISAYHKLKSNKGALTLGASLQTADEMTMKKVEKLSKDLREGTFTWTPIRRIEVPKPGKKTMRPLGIPTMTDKLVQEAIRLVLNVIYEPKFQELEANFGFRPKRSVTDAIEKIAQEKQGMTTAIEGDIKGAYDNVDPYITNDIMSQTIKDKKFMKLINAAFKCGIIKDGAYKNTLTGVPQGGISSPIIFNIYMHQFDIHIIKLVSELLYNKNIEENRKPIAMSRGYDRIRVQVNSVKAKIKRLRTEVNNKAFYKDFDTYKSLRKELRKKLSQKLGTKSISQKKNWLTFSYTRYADDWIILTNADKETCKEITSLIGQWIKTNLKLELSEEKTIITDLNIAPAKFLGYSIVNTVPKITKFIGKNSIYPIRRKLNVGAKIDIDKERVKNRLKTQGIISESGEPTHVKMYLQLKPWQIVEKFSQKLRGLFNYYFYNITNKSDLSYFYYLLRYSCLKSIANIQKSSIRQVITKYGSDLKIEYNVEVIGKGSQKEIKNRQTIFPKYIQLMNGCKKLAIERLQGRIIKRSNAKRSGMKKQGPEETHVNCSHSLDLGNISFPDVYTHSNLHLDPFDTTKVNLRTGFKLKSHCCICGCPNTSSNPIQAHHIRHIKKGNIAGFSEIMSALSRRTIPCCKTCHRKIHKGQYDGIALRELFDPIIAGL